VVQHDIVIYWAVFTAREVSLQLLSSVAVKDLRLKDEDKESSFKDKDLMSKDEDLKIGPRGSSSQGQGLSSRTTTLL